MTIKEIEWERYGKYVRKMKVDGGYLYESFDEDGEFFATCFVPDVDLQRYQAHLRDAYTQGYKDGQDELKIKMRNIELRELPTSLL